MLLDAIVVGGSFAGLSAALQLARARRRVAVIDAGLRRNRFATHSHGFLGRDGRAPDEIVAEAKAQLLGYPSVRWLPETAASAARTDDGFAVTTPNETLQARRLVIATGVVDQLPPIEGLAERWGRSVFHCPYCHGYELDGGPIGVLATGPMSLHQALMLPDWGPVTFFLDGAFEPDAAQAEQLAQRGVALERTRVARLAEAATVELADGRRIVLRGLFTMAATRPASPLAQQLGCALDSGPTGEFVRRNEMMETTVPGVFACGDTARMAGNVAFAVADGAMAGVAAHRSLIPALASAQHTPTAATAKAA